MVKKFAPLSVLAACVMSACASYQPPKLEDLDRGEFSVTVNKPFDEAWNAIIDFAGRTYFGIDSFEKESGLMTLTFGAGQPSEFVTGGRWSGGGFSGDYVDYLQQRLGGSLLAKMNVIARPSGPSATTVTVNTRYVFSCPPQQKVSGITFSFNTGSHATVSASNTAPGTSPQRTMRPTHKAERELIDAIKAF